MTWLFYIIFEADNPDGFLFVEYKEERPEPGLWHYLTSSLVILLGLLVIYTGRIRVIEFDNVNKTIIWVSRRPFCLGYQANIFEMESTKGVLGFKRGHKGNDINTSHFEILLFFKSADNEDGSIDVVESDPPIEEAKKKEGEKPFKLMDTDSNVKCSRQVKLINEFMGVHN